MEKFIIEDENLMSQWYWERNNEIKLNPNTLLLGSNKKAWWICMNGHFWQSSIANRTKKRTGCPYCANYYVWPGYNDLETKFPTLAKEFDLEKNYPLTPSTVLASGDKKYWWICKNNHSYAAKMNSRTERNNGCPYCSGHRVLKGFNDLATTHPELAKEWHPQKNAISPNDVSKGSSTIVYWICSKGHEYKSSVLSRTSGSGCPVCSHKQISKGYNDLATTHPNLAKEWHPTKNRNVTPNDIFAGSAKKYWWLCPHGHEFLQSPHLRTKGRSCPVCANEKHVSFPEKVFFYYLSLVFENCLQNYAPQWESQRNIDIFLPDLKLGIEYDGANWHQDAESDLIKNALCEKYGIKLIRIREKRCPILNSTSFDFTIEKEDYQSCFDFIKQTILKVYGVNIDFEINLARDRTIINELVLSSEKEQSILKTNPQEMLEWNYEKNGHLKPEYLTKGSTKKVWWKCSNGHEWLATISNRCRLHRGCPYCANYYTISGLNDLQTTHPNIIQWWDFSKNNNFPSQVQAGSAKSAWWICEKGHSFNKSIRDMAKNPSCPYCNNVLLLSGYNDFATVHPECVVFWNTPKNAPLLPTEIAFFSHKKVWWICENGHEYEATVASKSKGSGCPICWGRKLYKGINDLKTKFPDISKEFDLEKNAPLTPSDITSFTSKKVWWKCLKCGHSWYASVALRTKNNNSCPMCKKNKNEKTKK